VKFLVDTIRTKSFIPLFRTRTPRSSVTLLPSSFFSGTGRVIFRPSVMSRRSEEVLRRFSTAEVIFCAGVFFVLAIFLPSMNENGEEYFSEWKPEEMARTEHAGRSFGGDSAYEK